MRRGQLSVLIRREIISTMRDRTFLSLAGVCFFLVLFASYAGWQRFHSDQELRQAASHRFEEEWIDQEANPHSAAHYGTYLFKNPSVLGAYDPGLNTFLGTTYRVEAHVQHELNQAEVTESGFVPRLGELSIAQISQVFVPLLIFLITFQGFSKERQSGTLRLLRIQGVSSGTALWGKIGGVYFIVLLVFIPFFVLLAAPLFIEGMSMDIVLRYAGIVALYLVYFFIIASVGVAISVWVSNPRAAFVCSIGLWLLWAVLMPKAFSRVVDQQVPLPSRYEFDRDISQAYSRGMDQDGSSRERSQRYLEETLDKYGVDSVTQLPINFDGLAMQFSEDYNTKVFEHFAGEVESKLVMQNHRLEWMGLLDPLVAVRQLSMGLAGTDYYHHLEFHRQAKAFRDDFIRVLNMDMANSGSEYLSYSYQVGPEFFAAMEDFEFRKPDFGNVVHWHLRALLVLAVWLVLIFGALYLITIPQLNKRI